MDGTTHTVARSEAMRMARMAGRRDSGSSWEASAGFNQGVHLVAKSCSGRPTGMMGGQGPGGVQTRV